MGIINKVKLPLIAMDFNKIRFSSIGLADNQYPAV